MDVKTKGSEAGAVESLPARVFNEKRRSCVDCHTTRTPLWRGGPAGPRSLCNACGIRYRKTKRALAGLEARAEKRKRKNNKHGVSVKIGLMAPSARREVVLQKSLEEEEQAAILLMSLSYGYLCA